jgi:hypothetical protein
MHSKYYKPATHLAVNKIISLPNVKDKNNLDLKYIDFAVRVANCMS